MNQFIVFIKQIINGVQGGSVYALVALGYTMVYGIVRLINFAHGDFIMVGAYVSLFSIPVLSEMGLPLWMCIFCAVVICALLGVSTERIAYKPLRGSPSLSVLITGHCREPFSGEPVLSGTGFRAPGVPGGVHQCPA